MSDMTIPVGWTKYDSGNNTVTFRSAVHTAACPDLIKFKRTPPAGGTSKYQVLRVMGNTDESADESRNTLIDLNIRNVAVQNHAKVGAALIELGTLIATQGFADDVLLDGDLPL